MSDGSHWVYAPNKTEYGVVLADPPWSYKDHCNAGKRGVIYKYPTLTLEQTAGMPVFHIAGPNACLFLWATMPMLPEALKVMQTWGFTYKTVAFTWVKGKLLTPESGCSKLMLAWGMGNWSRANAELCLLGIKGKPKRHSAGVHSVIVRPRMEHSRKPPEVRTRIEELCGDVPRVELFARERVEGWDAWGNELEQSNIALELHYGKGQTRRGRKGRADVEEPSTGPVAGSEEAGRQLRNLPNG